MCVLEQKVCIAQSDPWGVIGHNAGRRCGFLEGEIASMILICLA